VSRSKGALALGALLGAALLSCAHVEAPSGGPEDRSAPRVQASFPDSGAVRVPLVDSLSLTFSEPMNRNTVETAFSLSPPIGLRARHWRGTRWILELEHPFEAGRTYVASLATSAVDRHKNGLPAPWSFGFSTGDTLDDGRAEGKIIGSRYPAKGVSLFVWPWRDTPPDTTKQGYPPEPLRVGQARDDGAFRLDFLPREEPLRIAAFFDRDKDQRHDPDVDFWAFLPDPLVVTDTSRGLRDITLYLAAFDEPGTVSGTLADSFCVQSGAKKSLKAARAERDSLRTFLRAAEGTVDRSLIEAIERRFTKGRGESRRLSADDSLAIGAALLQLDETMASARAESAYCALDTPIELLGEKGEVVRSVKGAKFAWSDVPPGIYHLRAFRDVNGNALPDSSEPRVEYEHALEVLPLRKITDLELALPELPR